MSFEGRVTGGISREVLTAFQGVSSGGAETGGILLGSRSGDRILVEDFEPVLCEHRFGPSYVLSDEDLLGLEESVQWFRTTHAGDLQVLGFYRSQTGPDSSVGDRDNELMRRFFPDSGSLFLLLKPVRTPAITAELFVFAESSLHAAGHPMLFPSSDTSIPARVSFAQSPNTGKDARVTPLNTGTNGRDTHPQKREPEQSEEPAGRNWTWVAALVALTLAGAVLGYRSVGPRNGGATSTAASKTAVSDAPSVPRTPASNPVSVSTPGTAAPNAAEVLPPPAVSLEMEQGVREALGNWLRALRSGDPDLVVACYASQLDRYFSQRNSSSAEVRRAAAQSVARYGKPAILRISDLTLTPLSDERAMTSFRKHWQTGGSRMFAGEVQEQLTFVKAGDAWKIASEEETKIYWTQRPR